MSQVKIQGNASGTGIFTVAAPNSNTDRTLTLPDGAGTLDRLERAGNVLQVVSVSYPTYFNTTSTTLVSSGLTASITPSSSSSKILVSINPHLAVLRNGASGAMAAASLQIVRGATSIYKAERGLAIDAGEFLSANISIVLLDSPATTSSTTYTLNVCCYNSNANNVRLNDYFTTPNTVGSTITLMEIAA